MPKRLFVCVSCRCHVKEGDDLCPFCGAVIQAQQAPAGAIGHLSRIAMVAMSAAVATTSVGAVACCDDGAPAADKPDATPPIDLGPVGEDAADGGPPVMAGDAYGVPPIRDAGDGGNPFMAGDAYGVPPIDAGQP